MMRADVCVCVLCAVLCHSAYFFFTFSLECNDYVHECDNNGKQKNGSKDPVVWKSMPEFSISKLSFSAFCC